MIILPGARHIHFKFNCPDAPSVINETGRPEKGEGLGREVCTMSLKGQKAPESFKSDSSRFLPDHFPSNQFTTSSKPKASL